MTTIAERRDRRIGRDQNRYRRGPLHLSGPPHPRLRDLGIGTFRPNIPRQRVKGVKAGPLKFASSRSAQSPVKEVNPGSLSFATSHPDAIEVPVKMMTITVVTATVTKTKTRMVTRLWTRTRTRTMSVRADIDITADGNAPAPGHTPQARPPAAVTAIITGAKNTVTNPPHPRYQSPLRKLNPTTPLNNPWTQR